MPFASDGPYRPPSSASMVWQSQEARILLWVLVFFGAYQPLSLLAAWVRLGPRLEPLSIVLGAVNACVAWAGVFAVRRGWQRGAAGTFVLVGVIQLWVGYRYWGLQAQSPFLLLQLLLVLVAGVVLGRRVLWATVVGVLVGVLCGAWRDAVMYMFARSAMEILVEQTLHVVAGFLVVSAVFDAALATLRRSLGTARRHSEELARSRDRLQLEIQEKERSRDLLVHAQKMEAVGRLAGGIAHDFNHLLGLVLGYARRGQRSADPGHMREALQGSEFAARRATAVARRLLDFSRLEANRPEVFDAALALEEMRPMLRQLLRPEVSLELAVVSPAAVLFDRGQLELIVLTLASNANDAMPGGGQLAVSVEEADGQVTIEAADTGTGMSAEALAHCFEPFFTTKPAGQGTGLGLAVAHDLVEASGGRMDVDSVPGQGCRFRIVLPCVETVATPG